MNHRDMNRVLQRRIGKISIALKSLILVSSSKGILQEETKEILLNLLEPEKKRKSPQKKQDTQ